MAITSNLQQMSPFTQHLFNYERRFIKEATSDDSFTGKLRAALVGRVLSIGVSFILHAEAVCRAVYVCFLSIKQNFQNVDQDLIQKQIQECSVAYTTSLKCFFAIFHQNLLLDLASGYQAPVSKPAASTTSQSVPSQSPSSLIESSAHQPEPAQVPVAQPVLQPVAEHPPLMAPPPPELQPDDNRQPEDDDGFVQLNLGPLHQAQALLQVGQPVPPAVQPVAAEEFEELNVAALDHAHQLLQVGQPVPPAEQPGPVEEFQNLDLAHLNQAQQLLQVGQPVPPAAQPEPVDPDDDVALWNFAQQQQRVQEQGGQPVRQQEGEEDEGFIVVDPAAPAGQELAQQGREAARLQQPAAAAVQGDPVEEKWEEPEARPPLTPEAVAEALMHQSQLALGQVNFPMRNVQFRAGPKTDTETHRWQTGRGHVGSYAVGMCHSKEFDAQEAQYLPQAHAQHLAKTHSVTIDGNEYPVTLFGVFDPQIDSRASRYYETNLGGVLVQKLAALKGRSFTEAGVYNAIYATFKQLESSFVANNRDAQMNQSFTATVGIIMFKALWTVRIGRSRGALDNGGNPIQVTVDPAGDQNVNEPGITKIDLKGIARGSHFVIGTRGIFNVASTQTVAGWLRNNKDMTAADLAYGVAYTAYCENQQSDDPNTKNLPLSCMVVKMN